MSWATDQDSILARILGPHMQITVSPLAGARKITSTLAFLNQPTRGRRRRIFQFYEIAQFATDRGEIIIHGDFGLAKDDGWGIDLLACIDLHAEMFKIHRPPKSPFCTEVRFEFARECLSIFRPDKDIWAWSQDWAETLLCRLGRAFPLQLVCACLAMEKGNPTLCVWTLPHYLKVYDGPERETQSRKGRRTFSHARLFTEEGLQDRLQTLAADTLVEVVRRKTTVPRSSFL